MPRRSQIVTLPEEVRRELDRRLVEGGFSGYAELAEWLAEQGYEISRSSVHRYGQQLQRRLEAIRASTEAALQIAEAAPDDADLRSAAVMSLLQTEIFEILLTLQDADTDDPEQRVVLLSRAARAIADLARASIAQKRHARQLQQELERLERDAPRLKAEDVVRRLKEVYGLA